jgi:hypothetical protein
MAVAQSSDGKQREQSFRQKVVESWGWKPGSGIGLTTTEYARDYILSHYHDNSRQEGEFLGRSRAYFMKTPLVLFQSKDLDVLVLPRRSTHSSPYGVAVLRRSSAEIVESDIGACGKVEGHWEFVDADGQEPLELMNTASGACGSGMTAEVFQLFDSRNGSLLLSQQAVADYGGRCPKLLSRIIGPIPDRQTRDASGHLVFELRLWFKLFTKHRGGRKCAPSKPKTIIRRTCTYQPKSADYECDDEALDEHVFSLPDIKTGTTWQGNADNLRWVLENAVELRARGFRFPSGFLERLPRHLP